MTREEEVDPSRVSTVQQIKTTESEGKELYERRG